MFCNTGRHSCNIQHTSHSLRDAMRSSALVSCTSSILSLDLPQHRPNATTAWRTPLQQNMEQYTVHALVTNATRCYTTLVSVQLTIDCLCWTAPHPPGGTSSTSPGSMRMDAFHFLAAPAPQCCSHCVGVNSRASCGAFLQSPHRHDTFCAARLSRPCMPLHITRIWGHRGDGKGSAVVQVQPAGNPHCDAHRVHVIVTWPRH